MIWRISLLTRLALDLTDFPFTNLSIHSIKDATSSYVPLIVVLTLALSKDELGGEFAYNGYCLNLVVAHLECGYHEIFYSCDCALAVILDSHEELGLEVLFCYQISMTLLFTKFLHRSHDDVILVQIMIDPIWLGFDRTVLPTRSSLPGGGIKNMLMQFTVNTWVC